MPFPSADGFGMSDSPLVFSPFVASNYGSSSIVPPTGDLFLLLAGAQPNPLALLGSPGDLLLLS